MHLIVSIWAVEEIYRRPYRVRRAARRGKEVTLAPETGLCPGDEIVQLFDTLVGFVLLVPKGAVVDESLLRQTIRMPGKTRD